MIGEIARRPVDRSGPFLLLVVALVWLALIIGAPMATVFVEAFNKGAGAFFDALKDPDAVAAIRLTLLVAAIAVPLNAAFGLAAAWSIAKFEFRGKALLLTLIDLPLSMSPVVSGLVWVLLFGARGWFGPMLDAGGVKIIFAVPGIVLGTILVTVPLIARELIPLMAAQGAEEELAATTLGAGGWTTFRRVTLPNVRWALLHGVLLCNARAMGEFGAVSVLSGHIRGLTETLPLHVEAVYNEYDFVGAFACASLLAGLAIVTLAAKTTLERAGRAAVIKGSAA
jgi:sulfate/thiosulfate transport system permease protein